MPDYSNTTGRTYCNASGSLRLNNNIITVRKIQPSETSRDSKHARAFGKRQPQGIIGGVEQIGMAKIAVPLYEWQLFTTGNPHWKDGIYEIVASYTEPTLGSFPYNHKRCELVKETPSESDGESAGEPLVELEFLPLAVEHKGKSGSART